MSSQHTHTHTFDLHFLIKFPRIQVKTEINDSENTSLVKVDMCAIYNTEKMHEKKKQTLC